MRSTLDERLREVSSTAYPVVGRGLTARSEAKQALEGGHGLPSTIVAKDEFIEINLELFTTHTVIGSDEPLLEIANSAVR